MREEWIWVVRIKARRKFGVCSRGGFTLIELLAVIAVIAVVAGMIIGGAAAAARKADVARAEADIQLIAEALDEYRLEHGEYLDTGIEDNMASGQDFDVLTRYVPDVRLRDPWDNPYRYTRMSAFSYVIRSWGPGGDLESSEEDRMLDDITNRR